MNAIQKYKDRVKQYGRKYVWSVILRNKVYIPLNSSILNLCKHLFHNTEPHKTIVIESHNDFDCNGGAIYDYLISNDYNKTYKIIWLLKHESPKNLPTNVHCFNIWKPSLRKSYYISTAKYSFADDVITPKINQHQTLIYCTHGGVTFKNVKGKVVVPDFVDYILPVLM